MAAPLQLNLLGTGPPAVAPAAPVERIELDHRCWVDVGRGWLVGADDLFERCTEALPWRRRTRPMYGELVEEPRLTASVGDVRRAEVPEIEQLVHELSERYGAPLRHVWANWYRDGEDAVAWHADRIGRTEQDPLVAIVTLGGPREFRMRPKRDVAGGPSAPRTSTAWTLHSGDLLVMGGSCQHRWEHTVPRRRGAPPRISLTFRAA